MSTSPQPAELRPRSPYHGHHQGHAADYLPTRNDFCSQFISLSGADYVVQEKSISVAREQTWNSHINSVNQNSLPRQVEVTRGNSFLGKKCGLA